MRQNRLYYGSTIGIVGGGQLGRMMATAAKHMGYRIVVLDPTEDCPTAQVSDHHIIADYADKEAIRQLAAQCDVVTYEFENVDLESANYLQEKGLLPQGSKQLRFTQDREDEKTLLRENGLPIAPFAIVTDGKQLQEAIKEIGIPSVLKTCRGGYDGKGQLKIETEANVAEAIQFVEKNGRCILEQWVVFDKEVSVVLTRGLDGDITFFPVAENEHKHHILSKTIVPARVPMLVHEKALDAAKVIAESIGVVGTFAIEMFVRGDAIYINEMAPRPHNSGHYTIEACNVSQFEQHVRAICGLPLVPVLFHGGAVMVNLLGEDVEPYMQKIDELTGAQIHMYGKSENKPKRKMGHITFVANELEQLQQIIDDAIQIEKV
ncbi:5-(carboxyamino)imidazole ribonucleotide synthase [Aquibacillus koreensis]|uniref:N5-carboxyaminoimidazole ribonucleotide synthase n=1 Tax=Aquibacillus koreensis TaxID=279446 RepID=A0A9X3WQE1_9BACI|nr:5-(carboxyamino)imidazole ribonucleotide synthase [Aquibacillus koreensis]MCT2536785.1 5-(carboxyamino)imidazole ribonucleotide synthase [Aquibacillus koreensis]MDC3421459.1 5-(carboxyamino)imidazole ribonucleotide synthase [Aquibacillus koreensis]